MVTQGRLKELLHYDPETGIFIRKIAPKYHPELKGKRAGYFHNGYRDLKIDGVGYKEHRLAFIYMNGELTTGQVDHLNGIKDDNRFCNLKEVTMSENQQNLSSTSKARKSGLPFGVTKHCRRYRAHIWVNSKNICLGSFDTPEEAHESYIKAKRKHHHWERE